MPINLRTISLNGYKINAFLNDNRKLMYELVVDKDGGAPITIPLPREEVDTLLKVAAYR